MHFVCVHIYTVYRGGSPAHHSRSYAMELGTHAVKCNRNQFQRLLYQIRYTHGDIIGWPDHNARLDRRHKLFGNCVALWQPGQTMLLTLVLAACSSHIRAADTSRLDVDEIRSGKKKKKTFSIRLRLGVRAGPISATITNASYAIVFFAQMKINCETNSSR